MWTIKEHQNVDLPRVGFTGTRTGIADHSTLWIVREMPCFQHHVARGDLVPLA